MDYQVDVGVNIKFTGEDGTYIFNEGDNVACYVRDGNIFVGKIIFIGSYRKNEGSEPEYAICLDTSKSETSYSREVIGAKDITYMCRYSLSADMGSEIEEAAGLYLRLYKSCYGTSIKVIETLIAMYNEAVANSVADILTFEEFLKLASENMEHVLSKKKVVKLLEGAKQTVAK